MHSASNLFSREITRHFDSYFEEYELATSYVELLLILHEQDELPQNDLAVELNLAPSTITRFVKKLQKDDWVEKKKVGRSALISLSDKGRALSPTLKERFETAQEDLRRVLGDKYVHTTKELLLHGLSLLRESK